MVAKINRGSSLYGALVYNHNKVGEGTARIISGYRMVGDVANIPENTMQRMIFSFEPYLAANRRTEKSILHISLNPSPQDTLTDDRLNGSLKMKNTMTVSPTATITTKRTNKRLLIAFS